MASLARWGQTKRRESDYSVAARSTAAGQLGEHFGEHRVGVGTERAARGNRAGCRDGRKRTHAGDALIQVP